MPDALDAALRQLAGHGAHLAALDAREAGHFAQVADRLARLGDLVTGLGPAVSGQAATLEKLRALDEQVAALAARPGPGGAGEGEGYRPSPAPPWWWKLHGQGRDEAAAKLAGWVEQVYRPGYGHLAASLGDCWDQHPLCLYVLDWLSELWSVLYLAPARTPGTLAGQAEWHTRLLAAAAEQLARETHGCAHHAAGYGTAATGARP